MGLSANLPANILEKLPPELALALRKRPLPSSEAPVDPSVRTALEAPSSEGLPTGIALVDRELPDAGLPKGAVVELAVQGTAALATSLALSVCRSAQRAVEGLGGTVPWCAFIDPSRSLYAPGVARAGVRLDRLLVVRPPREALGRVAIRLVESQCFAVVVIDTVGIPGAELGVSLGAWPRVVRRMSMSLANTQGTALLITDSTARRPLTLPVAQRVELCRSHAHKLILQVAKDRRGRVSAPKSIVLRQSALGPARQGASNAERTSSVRVVPHAS